MTASMMPVACLKLHPACGLVPKMAQEDWAAFLADVLRRGVQEPLTVQDPDVVLDGRHRLEAATIREDQAVPVRIVNLNKESQREYVIRSALNRRHLNEAQRAMLGARLKPDLDKAAKERQRGGQGGKLLQENLPEASGQARDQAGALVGVSGKSVDAAERVIERGSPKLIEAADAGRIPISVAAKLADLPKPAQEKALAGGKDAIKASLRDEQSKQAPPISDVLFKAFKELVDRISSIEEQFGGVRKMLQSKAWKQCDTGAFCGLVCGIADRFTKWKKEIKEYAKEHEA